MAPSYKNTLQKVLAGLSNCVNTLLFMQCLKSGILCEIPPLRRASWKSGKEKVWGLF